MSWRRTNRRNGLILEPLSCFEKRCIGLHYVNGQRGRLTRLSVINMELTHEPHAADDKGITAVHDKYNYSFQIPFSALFSSDALADLHSLNFQ